MDLMISPRTRYTEVDRPPTPEQAIQLFEERVDGWLLDPVRMMLPNKDAGHAILSVLSAYFENVGYLLMDKPGQYEDRATEGLSDVFADTLEEGAAEAYRESVRHGLYHTGFAKGDAVLWSEVTDISFRDGLLFVNPAGVVEAVERHVTSFTARLRTDEYADALARLIRREEASLKETEARIRERMGGGPYLRLKVSASQGEPSPEELAGGGPLPTGDFTQMHWVNIHPDDEH